MATRTISTKLAIQGESEYRASISRINTEIKALQSSLKLTESQFQTNANSMEALKAKGEALDKLYAAQKSKVDDLRAALENAQKAIKAHADAQEAAQKKVDAAREALEKLKKAEGDTSEEQKRLTEEIRKGEEEVNRHKAAIEAAEKGVNSWQTQLNNAQIKLNDLDAEVKLNSQYMAEAEKSTDGCATSIDRFGEKVKESASKADELATALVDAGVVQAVGKVKDALMECIDAAVQFEAEMAAVSRTTGITNEAASGASITLDELAGELRQMSAEMPITTSELAGIATTAGQLGIAQENIVDFTKVMAMLGTTTDLTADQAATMLAQFANITRLDPKNYDRLGATVAALGDSTATTASKIVDMSQGIAAVGSLAGMSEADILAIAAAVGSMGIEAQAGATAMNTFIQNIDKSVATGSEKLYTFAEVAGMSAGEFRAAWKNDAAEALNAVITGLGRMQESGKSTNLVLEELGITNARQVRAIMSLVEAGDTLTNTLAMADSAWESNTALSEKASVMYETAQAKIDVMNNKIGLLKEAIGVAFLPTIAEAAEKAGDFAKGLAQFAEDHPKTVQAIGAVVGALAALTAGLAAFQAAKKAAAILELGTAFGKISSAATAATEAIGGFAIAIGGSLAAGLGLIAGMAVPVVAGIYEFQRSCKETMEEGFLGEGHTMAEYEANVAAYTDRIEELKKQYEALSDSGADLTGIQGELDLANVGLAHATQELDAAQEAAKESAEDLADAQEDLEEAAELADGAVEDIKLSLQNVAHAYTEAHEAAKESIEGQLGLFGEFRAELSEDMDSVEEFMGRWAEQTVDMEKHTENLAQAAKLHISDELMSYLAETPEGAAQLQAILNECQKADAGMSELASSSQELVEKINNSFSTRLNAEDTLSSAIALMNEEVRSGIESVEAAAGEVDFSAYRAAVNEIAEETGVQFHDLGINAGEGEASGIEESSGTVAAAVNQMEEDAIAAGKTALDSHSPSKVFEDIGKDIDEGEANGITENTDAVVDAITEQANRLIQRSEEKIQELKAMLASETAEMPGQAYDIGAQIVDGMIAGINSRSSALYATMRNVVNSSMATARSAAAVNSPSKITTEMYEFVGDGMILGIENRRKALNEAMRRTVEESMNVNIDRQKIDRAIRSAVTAQGAMMEASSSIMRNNMPQSQIITETRTVMNREEPTIAPEAGRPLTVIVECDRTVLGRFVYQLNSEETQRVGAHLSREVL